MSEASPAQGNNSWLALLAVAGCVLALAVLTSSGPHIAPVFCQGASPPTDRVVMLSTSWCPYCAKARRYFNKHEIVYCEFDVENSANGRQIYERVGSPPVPYIMFGDHHVVGFQKRKIAAMLEGQR